MSDKKVQDEPLIGQIVSSFAAKPHPGVPRHDARPHNDRGEEVLGALHKLRTRIDEAIGLFADREAQADRVAASERGEWDPYHPTQVKSLENLRRELDRVESRFAARSVPHDGHEKPTGLTEIDHDLLQAAVAMADRFDLDNAEHNLEAHLAADLRKLETMLDERAFMIANHIPTTATDPDAAP